MMSSPLITIVVPVYKVPLPLLHKCLDSIGAQTSHNFEALLIDDGSPDECGKVCDKYAEKYDFMRVMHQDNGGLSVVRNNGIDNAKGDWVCFVDGDDWIEANTIEFAEQYIKDCPDGDVLIWEEYYDINGISKKNCFLGEEKNETICFKGVECKQLVDYILPQCVMPIPNTYAGLGTANARLYNRAFLIENNLYNKPGLKRMQDNVFNAWVFYRAETIYYRCERLYHYVTNESAATRRYTKDIADTMYFLYESFLEFIRTTGNEEYPIRLNIKFIRLLSQCFELNYAHPDNKKSTRDRLAEAKTDMQREYFRNIIMNTDVTGQSKKIKLIAFLLRHKMYRVLMILTRVNSSTRTTRLANRK